MYRYLIFLLIIFVFPAWAETIHFNLTFENKAENHPQIVIKAANYWGDGEWNAEIQQLTSRVLTEEKQVPMWFHAKIQGNGGLEFWENNEKKCTLAIWAGTGGRAFDYAGPKCNKKMMRESSYLIDLPEKNWGDIVIRRINN